MYDCFAAAAIETADGAFLLGVMGPHTANAAAAAIFPVARPIRDDIVGGSVDLDLSVRREFKEETGLDIADFAAEPGWSTVFDGGLIAHLKVLRHRDDAETLRARVRAYLAQRAAAGTRRHPHRARAGRFRRQRCRASSPHFWRIVSLCDNVCA